MKKSEFSDVEAPVENLAQSEVTDVEAPLENLAPLAKSCKEKGRWLHYLQNRSFPNILRSFVVHSKLGVKERVKRGFQIIKVIK